MRNRQGGQFGGGGNKLGTIQANNRKVDISGVTCLAETFKDLLPNLVDGITVSNVTAANFAAGKPNPVSDVNVSGFTFKALVNFKWVAQHEG